MLDPAVTVTIRVFRQCTPGRGLLAVEEPASYPGRYHRKGDPSIWYSSLSARGAWAELFRHTSPEIDPFEIRRRFGSATVRELIVLDLTSPRVRRRIGVTMRELTSEAWGPCLSVARRARRQGLDRLLVPSAALAGETNLVVFGTALHKVIEGSSSVRSAPRSMRGVDRVVA